MTAPRTPAVDGAAELVTTFHDAGILGVADLQVAHRIVDLAGGVDEPLELVVALTVRALRAGSVCVDLARLPDIPPDRDAPEGLDVAALAWPDPARTVDALRSSPLVSPEAGVLAPLRLVRTAEGEVLVYLDKYFRQESRVREVLAERAVDPPTIDEDEVDTRLRQLFPETSDDGDTPDLQALAARAAATHRTTVLAGGPGTGKTHTVARIVALLEELEGPGLRVGLAAPTGRAAAALQAAVNSQSDLTLPPVRAVTINRLLGPLPGGRRFRHTASHRLPYDVVIVDEASMVSLTMMFHLLDALRPATRLVLVGDPDQLASVDAGAVLADLVHSVAADAVASNGALAPTGQSGAVVSLRRRRRFGGEIGRLADAVRAGAVDDVVESVTAAPTTGGAAAVRLVDVDATHDVLTATTRWVHDMTVAAEAGDAAAALSALDGHRVLCAHRRGPAGVAHWSATVTRAAGVDDFPARPWFPGRPILLTETDRRAGLYNGDTGVVVRLDGEMYVAFPGVDPGSPPRLVRPRTLRGTVSAYATTIHRSQGSQYGAVTVIIPPGRSALLTRELLYTAITRATDRVTLVGTAEDLQAGVRRKVLRASGLRTTLTPVD